MKLIDLTKKYEGKFLTYYVATYLNSLGEEKLYEFISRDNSLTKDKFHARLPQGVGMVAFNKDKTKVLLQKEFRLACNEWVYNFPAGLIDEGEDVKDTVIREVKEETGADVIEVCKILPPSYASQGTSDEMMCIAICRCDGELTGSIYANEEIEANWYTKDEVLKLIENGSYMSVRTQMFLYQWAAM